MTKEKVTLYLPPNIARDLRVKFTEFKNADSANVKVNRSDWMIDTMVVPALRADKTVRKKST